MGLRILEKCCLHGVCAPCGVPYGAADGEVYVIDQYFLGDNFHGLVIDILE
jgi:hypothetical protein